MHPWDKDPDSEAQKEDGVISATSPSPEQADQQAQRPAEAVVTEPAVQVVVNDGASYHTATGGLKLNAMSPDCSRSKCGEGG